MLGILGIIEWDDVRSRGARLSQLLRGKFQRFARPRDCADTASSPVASSSVRDGRKDCRDVAEVLDQMAHAGRSQARGKAERKPLQSLFTETQGASDFGLHARKKGVQEETHTALLESNIVI